MSISIIHLTDVHFKSNTSDNPIMQKQDPLYKACQSVLSNKDNVVIIFSGDIAFSGQKSEYDHALDFIEQLRDQLKSRINKDIQVLLIPGNHDCDFSTDQSMRNRLLSTFEKSPLADSNTISNISSVQNNYFDFAQLYCSRNFSEICNKFIIEFEDKRLLFLLFNSSWMSTKKEEPGKLFLPKESFLKVCSKEYNCVISIMHHPYNWFQPDFCTDFIEYLRQTTDILILGHEHKKDEFKVVGRNWSIIERRGKELQNNTISESSFSIYQLDDAFQNLTTYDFSWNDKDNMYNRVGESCELFIRNSLIESSILMPSKEFLQNIEDPGIIINHFSADDIALSELYCWPILEVLELRDTSVVKIGAKIKENLPTKMLDANISILIGDSLCGRTSLAKMLFKEYSQYEKCCILCDGKDLNTCIEDNLKKIIDNNFSMQYSESKIEKYRQLEKSQRILIIDNYESIPYHDERRSKVLSILTSIFQYIVILSENEIEMRLICSGLENRNTLSINFYQILYMGNTKRKELVTKWYCLRNEYACGSDEVETKIINACEKINKILGSNGSIIPAAPIYLINILQNLDSAAPASFSGSQYGFLYDSLINKSLASIGSRYKNSGEVNIDINILCILAFNMLKNKNITFTIEELHNATTDFVSKKKVYANETEILNKMLSAKILCEVGCGIYKFRYPYIFYFFSGRYIAYNLTEIEVKEQIEYMCTRLYNEKYSNILIFVCHFANNIEIIEHILLLAYTTLDNYKPYDFNKHTEIYDRAKKIIEDLLIPKSVGSERDVEGNLEENLSKKDEAGIQDGSLREIKEITDEEAQREKDMASLAAAMKTIDVLGQIIRNYPGDIDGKLKIEIIDEIHKLGMRIVEAMLSTLDLLEHDLIAYIIEKVKDESERETRDEIIRKTQLIVSGLIAELTRAMISKVAYTFSNESLLLAIQETFTASNTVSQKLVMQELYFNVLRKPNIQNAIQLANEFDKNKELTFASTILRSIIANYLRYNHCGYSIRDQLCTRFHLSSPKYLIEESKNATQ